MPGIKGRELSQEEQDKALEMALQGQSLVNIAKILGFKSDMSFFNYRQRNPLFSKALDDMREASCAYLEDTMLGLADEYASAHHARIKLDSIAKVVSYRNPQRYGNKVDLTVTQTVDIGSSLNRMQERLDATYRDVTPALAGAKPNDSDDLW